MARILMPNKYTRYVILLDEVQGAQTTRQAVYEHVQHLKTLEKEGKLVICGPFSDYKGGIVVINVDTIDEAKHIAEADPFVKLGLRKYELRTLELSCAENNHMGIG